MNPAGDKVRWTSVAVAVLLLACLPTPRAEALSEPVGVWSCVLFGEGVRGDPRLHLVLTPEAQTFIATQGNGRIFPWRKISDWTQRRRELSFVDGQTARSYEADLRFDTLGGAWSEPVDRGGWWCARRGDAADGASLDLGGTSSDFYVQPIIPDRMATPRYPRDAIRGAIEGDTVVCFTVEASGDVSGAEIVSASHRIFEATTLSAIGRSRYRPARDGLRRPGCRSYRYTLDRIESGES